MASNEDMFDDTPKPLNNIFDELTLGELTDRTTQALSTRRIAAGEVAISEAEQNVVQDRAREIIRKTRAASKHVDDGGPLADIQAMHNLSLSIGLPTPRILFNAMVDAADAASDAKKKTWRRQIRQMSEVKETGCIKIDFVKGEDSAYLVLDECGPDHDLTAQLDKIYTRIPDKRREEILKHLSMLVYLGRAAYSQMMVKMMPTLTAIGKGIRVPSSDSGVNNTFDPRILNVDPANTTFYVVHASDRRVGIFVRLSSEIDSTEALGSR